MEPHTADRDALSEQAARRALTGRTTAPVLPALRQLTKAELLCAAPPPARSTDAGAVLEALCEALRSCVRRRPGWLYAALPVGERLPVRVRPALLHAAVLDCLRRILCRGDAAVVECRRQGEGVLLCVRGGRGGGAVPPLWRRMAREGGGTAVSSAGPGFAAAAWLPCRPGLPMQKAPGSESLLGDRFSLPYVFLSEFCAGPDE